MKKWGIIEHRAVYLGLGSFVGKEVILI